MAWLEKVAGKLKISVTTLVIILSAIVVFLITSGVLLVIFWQDITSVWGIRRLPEGEAISVQYMFTNEKDGHLPPNARLLNPLFDTQPLELSCMGGESNCELSFFYQPDGKALTLTTMILNEETGYPVKLSGVSLEFTGYEPYTAINVGITSGDVIGDTAGLSDQLKMVEDGDRIRFAGAEDWLMAQAEHPQNVVGKLFYSDIEEQYAGNTGLLNMKADEAEILLVELPFSQGTPPGWYSFEVSVQYQTPEEDRYRTRVQQMDVLVPERVYFYRYQLEDGVASVEQQYFVSVEPFTQMLSAMELNVSPSTNYTMIMQTDADKPIEDGVSTYWKYNLALGLPVQIHPPYSIGSAYPAHDGWRHVIMMPDYQWGLYDLSTDATILLDETARFITPVWSPEDRQLAFFHATEENTIGIFDIETETLTKVALTMNGTVKDMHWLSEEELVLLVQYGQVTNFYRYLPQEDLLRLWYGLAGLGQERFLVTSQGKIVALNNEFGVTIPELKHIYPLDYGSVGADGWYCEWMPTEFVAFCSTGGKVYLVDQVNETTKVILESGGLAGIEIMGSHGIAVITNQDVVHIFNIAGEEQTRFYIEGISQQQLFGLHFTFLRGH
ncbi:MAG: hypothetical protein V2J07_07895 [Anaerolineae bacterium]|jgi:hypothetical protein|nr:hypothetical protein [Anaerolineae bacterium]